MGGLECSAMIKTLDWTMNWKKKKRKAQKETKEAQRRLMAL